MLARSKYLQPLIGAILNGGSTTNRN